MSPRAMFVTCIVSCVLAVASVNAGLLMDYVFSQQGCKDARWDFNDGIYFSRMLNATSCVHDDDNGFDYWQTGAYLTRNNGEETMNAFVSSPIADQLESLIGSIGLYESFGNWTMIIWFTTYTQWEKGDSENPVSKPLYEIGSSRWDPNGPDYGTFGMCITSPDIQGYESWSHDVVYRRLQPSTGSPSAGVAFRICGDSVLGMNGTTYAVVHASYMDSIENTTYFSMYTYEVDTRTNSVNLVCNQTGPFGGIGTNWVVDWARTNGEQLRFMSYRAGSKPLGPVGEESNLNAPVHRFVVWDSYIDEEAARAVVLDLVPNSVPSTKNLSLAMTYGEQAILNLNNSDVTRDFDEDPIVAIRLLSLPSFGTLLHDGVAIEVSDLPYDFSGNLTYDTTDALHWSYPDCSLTTFQFSASDNGLNYSVSESFVHACISEVNFPPDVNPVTVQLPSASSYTFQVEATDLNDDFSPPSFDYGLMNATSDVETYRNTSKVSFLSINGTLGSLYLEDCETVIEAEEQYPLSTVFCYDSSNGDGSQGIDEFEVVVYDAVSSSDPALFRFNNTNPLVATTTSVTVDEHPAVGSFKLEVFDALGRDESIVAQILSLPLNGTLRHQQNNSVVDVGDLVDGNLTYTGNEYYFNEFSDGHRENFYGEALPDLDTFTYQVKETTVGATSDIATVSVHVANVFTPLVSMSGMNDEIEVLAGAPYALGSLVQIQDKDNEEYCVGILISTIDGRISFDVNQTHLVTIGPRYNNLTLGPCGSRMDDGCDEDLWFSARPRYINFLLSKMIFQAHKDKTLAASISFRGFKPGPNGITPENFEQTFTQSEPRITGKVNVNVNGTLTDSPTKSPVIAPTTSPTSTMPTKSPTHAPTREPGDQSMFIASIVLASVGTVLSVIALIVLCVVSGGPNKMCTRAANGTQAKPKTEGGADFDQEEMKLLGTGVYHPNDDGRVRLRRANPFGV